MLVNVGVDIFPSETSIGIPGEKIYFTCTDPSSTALGAQWLVNGTLLENSGLVNVFEAYNRRSKKAYLFFDLPLEHNDTTIQCIFNFATGHVSSEIITVLIVV